MSVWRLVPSSNQRNFLEVLNHIARAACCADHLNVDVWVDRCNHNPLQVIDIFFLREEVFGERTQSYQVQQLIISVRNPIRPWETSFLLCLTRSVMRVMEIRLGVIKVGEQDL